MIYMYLDRHKYYDANNDPRLPMIEVINDNIFASSSSRTSNDRTIV